MAHNDSNALYELIGAPLMAFVQAEFQATQATLEFIERFGFTAEESFERDDLGKLRMAKFRQKRLGKGGMVEEYDIEVPLLSLVPIPLMQIKEAELEFNLKVVDFKPEQLTSRTAGAEHLEDKTKPDRNDFLSASRLQMKVGMGEQKSRRRDNENGGFSEAQMRVKMNLEPADFPTGISHLLEMMDKNVNISIAPGMPASISLSLKTEGGNGEEIANGVISAHGRGVAPVIVINAALFDEEGEPVPKDTIVRCFVSGTRGIPLAGPDERRTNRAKTEGDTGVARFKIRGAVPGEKIEITVMAGSAEDAEIKVEITE